MTKKEQKLFIDDAIQELKDSGVTLGFFLKAVNISRTHWFFLKKGERPLIAAKQEKILEVLNRKSLNIDNK